MSQWVHSSLSDAPVVIINEGVCRKNIRRMNRKFIEAGIRFRPHFKTHRCSEAAGWFREEGVDCATVSSVRMAESFAALGWSDLTIAFPFNPRQEDRINRISDNIRLNILISAEGMEYLPDRISDRCGLFLEIDTGHGRSGIRWDNRAAVELMAELLAKKQRRNFIGLLTHAGHTYYQTADQIRHISRESCQRLASLKNLYGDSKAMIASAGDTPSCSVCDDFPGINEMRPGNFIFYDYMQHYYGCCAVQDISLLVYCPVVAVYPDRDEAVIRGGAVHFSAEFLITHEYNTVYAVSAETDESGLVIHAGSFVLKRVSQEHGIITGSKDQIRRLKPGTLLPFIPVHSCLTMHLAEKAFTTKGRPLHLV